MHVLPSTLPAVGTPPGHTAPARAWTRTRDYYATLATDVLPAGYMLTRTEAALRCGGFSRSWITRFLEENFHRIPAGLRPDAQLVVNRVPVEFVRWFLSTGRLLPRRDPSPAPLPVARGSEGGAQSRTLSVHSDSGAVASAAAT